MMNEKRQKESAVFSLREKVSNLLCFAKFYAIIPLSSLTIYRNSIAEMWFKIGGAKNHLSPKNPHRPDKLCWGYE